MKLSERIHEIASAEACLRVTESDPYPCYAVNEQHIMQALDEWQRWVERQLALRAPDNSPSFPEFRP